MDSDSLRLSHFILVIFHHGGSKPELVLSRGFRCFPHSFSMDSDSLRLSHFIPAIVHHGGSKPEAVLSSGFRCFPRGFSMDSDSLRLSHYSFWPFTSFRSFSIMAIANRKWFSQVVSDASHVVYRWILTRWGYPTLFWPFFIMAVTNRKWFSQGTAQSTDYSTNTVWPNLKIHDGGL